MAFKIQLRNDTAANWTSANPTLLAGEVGVESDTGKFKIGDGSTAWSSLIYHVDISTTATLTNKTINLSSNTLTGTTAQFNTALSDGNFATVDGSETLTNKTLTSPAINTPVITSATLVTPYGGGFTNMEVITSPTGSTWTVPTQLRQVGAKWKVTVIGGGGGGGYTGSTAGQVGGGGGSGGVSVGFYSYVNAVNTMSYVIGYTGSAGVGGNGPAAGAGGVSYTLYNSVGYYGSGGGAGTANGAGGAGGPAAGGTLNLPGDSGDNGGTMAATSNYQGTGGDTPLGYGFGGEMPATSNGAAGNAGANYGAGGSGGRNGTGTTVRSGGAGAPGAIIIEY